MPENENVPVKKPDVGTSIFALIVWGFVMIATVFGTGGLAVLAIKWFVSLIKGGL